MPHASPRSRPEGVRLFFSMGTVLLLLLAASTSAAAAASHSGKDAVMVVVGSPGCRDTALLAADCSYKLVHAPPGQHRGAWVPGTLHSQQQVPVTALPPCTHSSNARGGAKTVFVLHRTGEAASWRIVDHAQLPGCHAAAAELLQSWLGLARVSDSCLAGDSPAEPPRFHRQLMQAPAAPGNSSRAPPPAPAPALPTGSSDTAPTNSTSTNSTAAGALAELQAGSPGAARILGSQNPTATLTAAQARVLCALQVEVGPCRGSLPRWAYDVAAGACQQFVWGGCDGNGNNFASAAACEATCGAMMTGVAGNATTGAPSSNTSEPTPAPILVGPVDTTLEPERMLARVEEITPAVPAPVPPPTSSAGQQRSRAGRRLHAVAAGTVGALAVLLL